MNLSILKTGGTQITPDASIKTNELLVNILNKFNEVNGIFISRKEKNFNFNSKESKEIKLHSENYGTKVINDFINNDQLSSIETKKEFFNYISFLYPIILYQPRNVIDNVQPNFKLINRTYKNITDFEILNPNEINYIKTEMKRNFKRLVSDVNLYSKSQNRNETLEYSNRIFNYLKKFHPIYFTIDKVLKKNIGSIISSKFKSFLEYFIKLLIEYYKVERNRSDILNGKVIFKFIVYISSFLIIMDYDYIIKFQIKDGARRKEIFQDKSSYLYHRLDKAYFNECKSDYSTEYNDHKYPLFKNSIINEEYSIQTEFIKGYSDIITMSRYIIKDNEYLKGEDDEFFEEIYKQFKVNIDYMFIPLTSFKLLNYHRKTGGVRAAKLN